MDGERLRGMRHERDEEDMARRGSLLLLISSGDRRTSVAAFAPVDLLDEDERRLQVVIARSARTITFSAEKKLRVLLSS